MHTAKQSVRPARRTIAVLSCTWDIDFMRSTMNGIRVALEGQDCSVHVFQTCDTHEWGTLSTRKEEELFALFDPDRYDGMLIAANGYGNIDRIRELSLAFQASGKPLVCISTEIGVRPNVGIHNADAMFRLTTHLIEAHGARTFRILAGPENVTDSSQRLHGILRALEEHGLSLDPAQIYHGDFTVDSGALAWHHFRSSGLPPVDAVISANDGMALGYCGEAEKEGIVAPRDFLITGFDNAAIADGFIPALTTVSPNLQVAARRGAEALLRLMNGGKWEEKGGTEKIILRASCGCPYHHDFHADYLRMNRKYDERSTIGNNMRIGIQELIDQDSPEGLQRALPVFLRNVGLGHMALLLNPKPWRDKSVTRMTCYEDRMILCSDDGFDPDFPRSALLPEDWEERTGSRFSILMALYDQDLTLGYAVSCLQDNFYDLFYYRTLMGHLGVSVDSIRQRALLHQANQELERLYVTDSLTSLYNRFGYSRFGEPFYQARNRKIAAVMADLDCLKELNDQGGHDDGDYAIRAVADALRTVFPSDAVLVRMGGDEFLILTDPISPAQWADLEFRTQAFLKERAARREPPLPVTPGLSMGYVISDGSDTLEHVIRQADERMYERKALRKKQR